jgi:hypothetical protein
MTASATQANGKKGENRDRTQINKNALVCISSFYVTCDTSRAIGKRLAIAMDSMTGEQIQALANDLPPLTPKGLGSAVEVVACLFGAISLLAVSLRIYVRSGCSVASSRHWGIEDYLVLAGIVS